MAREWRSWHEFQAVEARTDTQADELIQTDKNAEERRPRPSMDDAPLPPPAILSRKDARNLDWAFEGRPYGQPAISPPRGELRRIASLANCRGRQGDGLPSIKWDRARAGARGPETTTA